MMPPMQIDRGAIKHILGGANVMCPGLISKGGKISEVKTDTIVVFE
jgi:PUA domain protein